MTWGFVQIGSCPHNNKPYYLGSILGPLILETPTWYIFCHAIFLQYQLGIAKKLFGIVFRSRYRALNRYFPLPVLYKSSEPPFYLLLSYEHTLRTRFQVVSHGAILDERHCGRSRAKSSPSTYHMLMGS